MKKRILFSLMALFMLSLTFVSCGDDDDDDNSNAQSAILGKWKCQSAILYVDGKQDDEETWNATDSEYSTYEFKSDGTVVESEVRNGKADDNPTTCKYSISGNKLTLTYTNEHSGKVETDECTFSINGNTLVLTAEDTEDGHTYKEVDTYVKM